MGKIRIVTDSTADLPRELLEKHKIAVVPLRVHFGPESFKDHIELSASEFYEKLASSQYLPKTSQPSPADFAEAYQNLAGPGDTVISIHLSSELSGTYQSANLARSMVRGVKVEVIDTRAASMGIGLIVLAAARAAEAGRSPNEVVAAARSIIDRLYVLFSVDTLEYLQRNGRIGRAQALLGTLLNIKPLLHLKDGIVSPLEKVRGKAKVIPRLLELARERVPVGARIHCAVIHGNCPEEGRTLLNGLKSVYEVVEESLALLGPVIATHAGPGTLGLCLYQD